ncbi:hypothetical protein C8J56DRAFT_774671 [Mycena floridula]|nr:hypothetical protein C8J56DRAFT_774671 [Mycena floridula]
MRQIKRNSVRPGILLLSNAAHHSLLERLKAGWNSGVYGFFTPSLRYTDTTPHRKYHFFRCNSTTCKGKPPYGVKRYLDTSDHSSTSGLSTHAKRCFGEDLVNAAKQGAKVDIKDSSIHASFGRTPVHQPAPTHRPLTMVQLRTDLVRWITENNRPMHIVTDRKFADIVLAGRPGLSIPSQATVARDIKAAFDRSIDHLKNILDEYPGHISISTDAWTSPNHRPFVAWVGHLHWEGKIVTFLIDIYEVAAVRTL